MTRFMAFLLAAFLGLPILELVTDIGFAQVAFIPAPASTSDLKLAAKKKHHRENVKEREKRAECEAQAQKLLSDSERPAYVKECMSEVRTKRTECEGGGLFSHLLLSTRI